MATPAYLGQFRGTLLAETCFKCGVVFGMTSDFHAERREDHGSFYCPNGHGQVYVGKSEAEKAREEVERQRQAAEYERNQAAYWRRSAETAQRSAAATRGVVTRIKRRVGKGVCPCCTRTFADLARHMTGQHPDWSNGDER